MGSLGKTLLVMGFVVGLLSQPRAQPQAESRSSTYAIGDQVPDLTFSGLIGYSSATAQLSEFRDKLVILDFWATWCTACVQAFPKMERLQAQFNDRLQIIAITREDSVQAAAFLANYAKRNGRPFSIPSATGSTLYEWFPHRTIPHYVWLDGQGKVIATSDSKAVTAENIQAVLQGGAVTFPMKRDMVDFDRSAPLFIDGNGGNGDGTIYRSLLSGPIQGLGRIGFMISDKNTREMTGVRGINNTIVQLYMSAMGAGISTLTPDHNRIVVETGDTARLKWSPGSGQSLEAWEAEHAYCYELITAPALVPDIRKQVLQDLDRYFGLSMQFEQREQDCWVLSALEGFQRSHAQGGEPHHNLSEGKDTEKYMANVGMATLLYFLNRESAIPIVNETGYSGNLELRLPADLADIPALQRMLAAQGMALGRAKRPLEVLVIGEKEKPTRNQAGKSTD